MCRACRKLRGDRDIEADIDRDVAVGIVVGIDAFTRSGDDIAAGNAGNDHNVARDVAGNVDRGAGAAGIVADLDGRGRVAIVVEIRTRTDGSERIDGHGAERVSIDVGRDDGGLVTGTDAAAARGDRAANRGRDGDIAGTVIVSADAVLGEAGRRRTGGGGGDGGRIRYRDIAGAVVEGVDAHAGSGGDGGIVVDDDVAKDARERRVRNARLAGGVPEIARDNSGRNAGRRRGAGLAGIDGPCRRHHDRRPHAILQRNRTRLVFDKDTGSPGIDGRPQGRHARTAQFGNGEDAGRRSARGRARYGRAGADKDVDRPGSRSLSLDAGRGAADIAVVDNIDRSVSGSSVVRKDANTACRGDVGGVDNIDAGAAGRRNDAADVGSGHRHLRGLVDKRGDGVRSRGFRGRADIDARRTSRDRVAREDIGG